MKNRLLPAGFFSTLGVAAAVAVSLVVSGCGGPASAQSPAGSTPAGTPEVKELRYQGSANNVSLPELAQDLGYLGDVKLNWVGNTISGPQDIQSVATNQTDFGGAFAGAVVKLIEAGAPVKAVVNYYGEDAKTFIGFYVKDGQPHPLRPGLHRQEDRRQHPRRPLRRRHQHLPAEERPHARTRSSRSSWWSLPPNDTEEAIRRGQVDVGALGGVLQDHAIAAGGLRSVFSDYELFGTFAGGQYVLRNDFIAKNPEHRPDLRHRRGQGDRVGDRARRARR